MFFLINLQLLKNIFHLYPLMTHSERLQQQQLLSLTLFEKQNPNKQESPPQHPQNPARSWERNSGEDAWDLSPAAHRGLAGTSVTSRFHLS